MLKACPRCQELVLDTSGECKHCKKRFAPDKLPALTKFEASKLLTDRQKEKAQLGANGVAAPKRGWAWLKWPLMAIGLLLGAVASFFLLHLLVMDLTRDPKITAGVTGLTLLIGWLSSAAMGKGGAPAVVTGRFAEVERDIRMLEDEVERFNKKK